MGKVLQLQRELWERVARQARRIGTAGRPALLRAVEEFEASFPEDFRRIERERVLARLADFDLVLVGDYHPLPRAQLTAAYLVRALRPACVALEILPSESQGRIDAWLESDEPAEILLADVRFETQWGRVPTRGYEALLESARDIGCRIVGIEPETPDDPDACRLVEREARFADRLRACEQPCLALIGDVHLNPDRLPTAFGNSAAIVHQNYAPYHFRLQEAEVKLPALLQLDARRYVWQHTHPLLVEESCLTVLSGDREAHAASPEEWLPAMIERVANTLGVDAPEPPAILATFEPDQRDVLSLIVDHKRVMNRLLDRLFIQGQAFIGEQLLVLHLPGCNHIASAAGKWIARSYSPPPPETDQIEVQIFAETRYEAAGWLASKLVNPLREGKPIGWYRDFLDVKLDWKRLELSYDWLAKFFDRDQLTMSPWSRTADRDTRWPRVDARLGSRDRRAPLRAASRATQPAQADRRRAQDAGEQPRRPR